MNGKRYLEEFKSTKLDYSATEIAAWLGVSFQRLYQWEKR